jgi:exopolysaccharide biosynthesis polyprenyl glycosylphosphotransferase
MNAKEQYKHLLNYGANLITLLVEGGLFAFIWYSYYSQIIYMPFYRRGNWAVIGLYVLIIFFFTKVFGGYNIGYLRMTDMALSHVLAIVLSGIVAYLEVCMIGRDYMNPEPVVGMMLVEVLFILPWVYIIRKMYSRLYPPRQMLVIYGHYAPDDLIGKINTRKDRYNICASVSYEIGYEKLYPMIDSYNAVVLCDLPAQARNQIMKYCYQASIRTYVTPKISDILFRGADDIHLFDTPLLLSRNQGLSIDQRIVKRIWDVVLSILGIILSSPFMLLIALAVKLYDGGPVLYKQERLTRDGKPFMIYKFRSMSMDSEKSGARLASKGDKRVTPVGNVIRNIHFDELPQLFNILKGDMSMVGPRPERQEISDKYAEEIPEFVLRTKVKAGLTGYAQVYGKYNTTPYDKLKLDLTYIENYSLWLDFKILLLTFKILFVRENTEGVDEEQKTALK